MYLKGRAGVGWRDGDRQRFSVFSFTLQMVRVAGAGPGWSQGPRTIWDLDNFPRLSQVHSRERDGKWSSRDLNQCSYGMLLWLNLLHHRAGPQ